ncbi:MAG: ATP-binding protein [Kofleriaceae bacterium]
MAVDSDAVCERPAAPTSAGPGRLRGWYESQIRRGVDEHTPAHLVDRVIYSNFIYLTAGMVNAFMAIANASLGDWTLVALNGWYHGAVTFGVKATSHHRYLIARLGFLIIVALGFTLETLAQGTTLHGPPFLLMLAVTAFGMFHPTERRYSVVFGVAMGAWYLAVTVRGEPFFYIEALQSSQGADGQIANDTGFTIGFLCALIGVANAYGGATRLLDEQRARVFEDSRLSALGAMSCNVAHEINTPLMAIDLHLDELDLSLSEDPAREPERELVGKLGLLSRRIATIVRSFKLVSHGGADDPPSDTTLGAIVGAAVDLARGRTKPLGVALTVSLPDEDVALRCRVVGVSQIILNLITNAVDAVAELPLADRWIRIQAEREVDRVVLTVTDSGKIRDPVVRQRLFETFFTTKPLGKGTGLGLAVSRQTAEDHGGRLWYDAHAPRTRFVLELPSAVTRPVAILRAAS